MLVMERFLVYYRIRWHTTCTDMECHDARSSSRSRPHGTDEYDKRGGFIMYTLFIGEVAFVGFISLFRRTKSNIAASHSKTSWDNVAKIEQDIQKAKESVAHWGFPLL
jgi:hypothetical protein